MAIKDKEVVTLPSMADTVTKEEVEQFLLGSDLANKLSPAEKTLAINTAVMSGLNPFKREVHFVKYKEGSPLSIITAYNVPIKRAERTGKLNGWDVRIEGDPEKKNTWKAVITIHRKDWDKPFVHEVYYPEAVQTKFDGTPTAQWAKQPRFLLKKTAIGQGFRLAFPDELGGLPYVDGEFTEQESRDPQEVRQELNTMAAANPPFEGKAAREEREAKEAQTVTKEERVTEEASKPEDRPLPWEEKEASSEASAVDGEVVSSAPTEMTDEDSQRLANEVEEGLNTQSSKVTEIDPDDDWVATATEENPVTEPEMKMMYDLAAKKGFPEKEKFDSVLCNRFKIDNVTLMSRDDFTTTMNGLAKAKDR